MKKHISFFWYKKTPLIFGRSLTGKILATKMKKYLIMLESSFPSEPIEEEKLSFFTSKISIQDFFNVSECTYRAYLVDEKTRMFTKYYSDLYEKYYGTGNFIFLSLLCILLGVFFSLCLSIFGYPVFERKKDFFRFICNVN